MISIFKKIESFETNGKWISNLANSPEISAEGLKAKFDEIARDIIIPKFNALVDNLIHSGAIDIGIDTIKNLDSTNVQKALEKLFALNMDRYTKAEADILLENKIDKTQFEKDANNMDEETLKKAKAYAENIANEKADFYLSQAIRYTNQTADETLINAKNISNEKADVSLSNAKKYADNISNEALVNAKSYAYSLSNEKATETLNNSKSYTDNKTNDTLIATKEYIEAKIAEALANAKEYTDTITESKTGQVLKDAKIFAERVSENSANQALSNAKAYTENQSNSILAEAKAYTDYRTRNNH